MALKQWTFRELLFHTDLNNNFNLLDAEKLPATDPELGTFRENVFTFGNLTGTATIDISAGTIQTATVTGDVTVSFSGIPVETGQARSVLLVLTQDATGERVITWPAGIAWFGTAEPSAWPADESVAVTLVVTSETVFAFTAEQDFVEE